jgi:hypothetical protein
MATRTTNGDIVGANDFVFANNLGHYRGQLAAKLAKGVLRDVSQHPTDHGQSPARITPLSNHVD